MKIFEPLAVDEKINKLLVKVFQKITYSNFQVNKVNQYAYHCKYLHSTSTELTRYYVYLLLNEFTRSMYIGMTKDIKTRLNSHARQQVLGPNEEVLLNILFIIDLEEISIDKGVLSPTGQVIMIEKRLTEYLYNKGYDVRCQFKEFDSQVIGGFETGRSVKRINYQLLQKEMKKELVLINKMIEYLQQITDKGGYTYEAFGEDEIYRTLTHNEITSLQYDVRMCKELLVKNKSEYTKQDWELLKKCLLHPALRMSFWEQGFRGPEDLVTLKHLI